MISLYNRCPEKTHQVSKNTTWVFINYVINIISCQTLFCILNIYTIITFNEILRRKEYVSQDTRAIALKGGNRAYNNIKGRKPRL